MAKSVPCAGNVFYADAGESGLPRRWACLPEGQRSRRCPPGLGDRSDGEAAGPLAGRALARVPDGSRPLVPGGASGLAATGLHTIQPGSTPARRPRVLRSQRSWLRWSGEYGSLQAHAQRITGRASSRDFACTAITYLSDPTQSACLRRRCEHFARAAPGASG